MFRIDTMHGDEICDGIETLEQAERVAQRCANQRGESVYVFGDDLSDD